TPDASWAYKAIAKLGGWTDSKRTGKAAWSTIWNGWSNLNERIEGFLIAQSILMNKM
ncbi:IS4 family transposase, partial [Legionella pneumophila]